MPEMRARIMGGRDWDAIAEYQLKKFFSPTEEQVKEEMKALVDLYASDVYDDFLGDPKCASCGDAAQQRCSKCKSEWYCSRECQLTRWKDHKPICKVASEARAKLDADNAERAAQFKEKAEKKKKPLIEEIN